MRRREGDIHSYQRITQHTGTRGRRGRCNIIVVVNLVLMDNNSVQIPKNISLERLDDGLPMATARRVSDSEPDKAYSIVIDLNVKWTGMNRPLSQSRTLVKHSCMSNDRPSIHGGMTARPQPNEEPAITATLPWYSRILASVTVYGDLFAVRTPEEFALVHTRLQQEWIFNGGFVSLFTIILLNSQLIRSSM